jgi:hypothetical protein
MRTEDGGYEEENRNAIGLFLALYIRHQPSVLRPF